MYISILSLSRWSRPSQVNGVLEFYSIFLSHDDAEPVLAYNSSDLFEDYTLRNLTPGTAYIITLAVSPSLLHHILSCKIPVNASVFHYVCLMSGLHGGRVYLEPTEPGSDRGEHPRECSCATGHSFVPTCIQHQLDTSKQSER